MMSSTSPRCRPSKNASARAITNCTSTTRIAVDHTLMSAVAPDGASSNGGLARGRSTTHRWFISASASRLRSLDSSTGRFDSAAPPPALRSTPLASPPPLPPPTGPSSSVSRHALLWRELLPPPDRPPAPKFERFPATAAAAADAAAAAASLSQKRCSTAARPRSRSCWPCAAPRTCTQRESVTRSAVAVQQKRSQTPSIVTFLGRFMTQSSWVN